MEKKYYLHRISHESEISYPLLERGFLTLGWEKFSDSSIVEATREIGYPKFDPRDPEVERNKHFDI